MTFRSSVIEWPLEPTPSNKAVTPKPTTPSSGDAPLAPTLARWSASAHRLGLGDAASAAGALLLVSELDEEARTRLLGDEANTVAPRRADLLRVLAADHGEERAIAGLVALEQRGVAAPLRTYAGPWALAELELDPRVRAYCVAHLVPDGAAHLGASEPHPLARVERALKAAVTCVMREPTRRLLVLRGRSGSGRDHALSRLALHLGAPVFKRSVYDLRQSHDPLEPELSGAIAVWDARRFDPSPDDIDLSRRFLARGPTLAVALLDPHHDAPDVDARLSVFIDLDPADALERRLLWETVLARVGLVFPLAEAAALRLSQRSHSGAGLATRAVAQLGDSPYESASEVVASVEEQLATFINPSALRGILVERPSIPLDGVIVSDIIADALRNVLLLAEMAGALEAAGRAGVKALFSGPSGTGKTMAARAIATELRLPLYRVDLAGVVSKWVGETEKNLREALTAAETAGAVLLFDEGDALFGKRGEVNRGTDRYANMEVAYLLQAIEAYRGIVIVTTNLRNNVDKAFERRFDVCAEFQPPTPKERERIWQKELGEASAALPDGLLGLIARRAELHGGSIAQAARIARALALRDGRTRVGPQDLHLAIRGELLKTGSSIQAARWTLSEEEKVKGAGQ